jgi:hypothetical protein
MKLTHIRVPGRNSPERLTSIRESYLRGELNIERLLCTSIKIDTTAPFWIGARYSHPNKKADDVISELADSVDDTVRESIKVGMGESVIVTDAQFVIVVTDMRGAGTSTDDREAKARANDSIFDLSMWDLRLSKRLRNWSRPRLVIYDYDGHDGRKVWSWVFHLGPLWFIRERYAL